MNKKLNSGSKQFPLKITFILTQSLESPGGGGRYFPLARALVKQGHTVTIIALHHDYAGCHRRRFVKDGVAVHYAAQMHVRKIDNRKEYYPPLKLIWIIAAATVKLSWAALRTPSDIIHVGKMQPMNGIAARIVNLIQRVPVFLDSDDYEAVHNRFDNQLQKRIVAWFENWMPSFSSGMTANTTFLADYFQRRGYPADKMLLLPNGADRERFAVLDLPDADERIDLLRQRVGLTAVDRVVVYIGSMSLTSHAIDMLLEAFARLLQQEPNAYLLLAGSGESLAALKKMVGELGIGSRVNFVGRVTLEEIPYYYRLGEVTVDPRRDSLIAQSSLSLKLIESIAAGVPCVTADIGDRRSIVGEAGLAVPPDDAAALMEGVLSILHDGEMANRMRCAAKRQRETLWWDGRSDDLLALYLR